jgi:molybdopterin converting factor small subunit
MPHVSVHLYATLRQYAGGAPSADVKIEPGQTVADVLRNLGIPLDQTRIVFVDHRAADVAYPLRGGERVGVFPAIGGG